MKQFELNILELLFSREGSTQLDNLENSFPMRIINNNSI